MVRPFQDYCPGCGFDFTKPPDQVFAKLFENNLNELFNDLTYLLRGTESIVKRLENYEFESGTLNKHLKKLSGILLEIYKLDLKKLNLIRHAKTKEEELILEKFSNIIHSSKKWGEKFSQIKNYNTPENYYYMIDLLTNFFLDYENIAQDFWEIQKLLKSKLSNLDYAICPNCFDRINSPINDYCPRCNEDLRELTKIFEERRRLEKEIPEKIRRMMEVSTRINLDRMQNVLNMDKKNFDNKIFEWAVQFGFIIDGDYLIINKDTVFDFIDSLDKQFILWEKEKEKK